MTDIKGLTESINKIERALYYESGNGEEPTSIFGILKQNTRDINAIKEILVRPKDDNNKPVERRNKIEQLTNKLRIAWYIIMIFTVLGGGIYAGFKSMTSDIIETKLEQQK